MPEADQPNNEALTHEISSKWTSLTQAAQEAAFMLVPASQLTGVDISYFIDMGFDQKTVDELVSSGLVEQKSGREIARQYLADNKALMEELRVKKTQDFRYKPTPEEESVSNIYWIEERVAKDTEHDSLRHRFTPGVHDFAKAMLDQQD